MKIFVYTVILIVAASIIAGFFIVGSPSKERLVRLDEGRASDLQFIQSEIVNFWMNKDRLPETLSELEDDLRGVIIPIDPESKEPYEYQIISPLSFRLCARFSTASREDLATIKPAMSPFGDISVNWEHGLGHWCFDRTIDPDFYRPNKPSR